MRGINKGNATDLLYSVYLGMLLIVGLASLQTNKKALQQIYQIELLQLEVNYIDTTSNNSVSLHYSRSQRSVVTKSSSR